MLMSLSALGLPRSAFDASNAWSGVLSVSVDRRYIGCAATVVAARLAVSSASCFRTAAALSEEQQRACLRGECPEAAFAPAASIRLLGGRDPRVGMGGYVAARVQRVRFVLTSRDHIGLKCDRAFCGEGWDVALLQLLPSCDISSALACPAPVGIARSASAAGLRVTSVGFGDWPGFDRRLEWDLQLAEGGGGVRRHAESAVVSVQSEQLLHLVSARDPDAAAGAAGGAAGGAGALCTGDAGAALIVQRGDAAELVGVGLAPLAVEPESEPFERPFFVRSHSAGNGTDRHGPRRAAGGSKAGAACAHTSSLAWSTWVSRCWIEDTLRRWALPPLVQDHADECGAADLFPPDLATYPIGAAPAAILARAAGNTCASVDCRGGECVGGACVCGGQSIGPLCTIAASPLPPLPSHEAIHVAAAGGADDGECGSLAAPCATIEHALLLQYWLHVQRPAAEAASVVLLNGTFGGGGNRGLTLHGNPVNVTSLHGAEACMIDCSPGEGRFGSLVARGETGAATFSDLSLRLCVSESQAHGALASHPGYATHVAGAAGWPATREPARFLRNLWRT